MNAQAWIALVGFCVVVAGLLVNAGMAFQKLNQHGKDIETLKSKTDSHASDLAGIAAIRDLLDEVRQDVKSLLTGRRGRGPTDP